MATPARPRIVHIDQRKWPDTPHWRFDALRLGGDEYGTWAFVTADTVLQRGEEPPRRAGIDFVVLIPPHSPWIIEFYRDHPAHTVYVNIGTIPIWHDDRVSQVDLDLDVIRTLDEVVSVVDQDEFQENQRTLAYPDDIFRLAERAMSDAVDLVTHRVPPFDDTPLRWWDLAEARS